MGERSAFFYGTLMAPQLLRQVTRGSNSPSPHQPRLIMLPALLEHFARHRVQDCDYPAIVPTPESCVRGTYVHGLTDADVGRLDVFEGYEYVRQKVHVKVLDENEKEWDSLSLEPKENSRLVEAETYVWVAGDNDLDHGEWDFEDFKKNKMHRWLGGDELKQIDEAVKAAVGDPTGGRGLNGGVSGNIDEGRAKEVMDAAV